jgi:hypothetical protein
MPLIQIFSLCVIIGAFVLFALVLAWGDYQTRHIVHVAPEARPQSAPGAAFEAIKAAAAKAKAAPSRNDNPASITHAS